MRIDTDVSEMIVEIDDKEYSVAPRTVAVMEKLTEAQRANEGKPAFKLWKAELEILLGKAACKELFKDGQNENIDRMQMIYEGVASAFLHNENEARNRRDFSRMEAVATALEPLNELLRNLSKVEKKTPETGNIREIRRA